MSAHDYLRSLLSPYGDAIPRPLWVRRVQVCTIFLVTYLLIMLVALPLFTLGFTAVKLAEWSWEALRQTAGEVRYFTRRFTTVYDIPDTLRKAWKGPL